MKKVQPCCGSIRDVLIWLEVATSVCMAPRFPPGYLSILEHAKVTKTWKPNHDGGFPILDLLMPKSVFYKSKEKCLCLWLLGGGRGDEQQSMGGWSEVK